MAVGTEIYAEVSRGAETLFKLTQGLIGKVSS
jgi:hypothetical protein